MAHFLADLSDGLGRWTVSSLILLDKIRKQGNTPGEIHTNGFIGQNSRHNGVEMQVFDSVTKVTETTSYSECPHQSRNVPHPYQPSS